MNRQQKEGLISDFSEKFALNKAAFVVNCQSMAVSQVQELRFALGEKEGEIHVAKNRLVRIALEKSPECECLKGALVGQNAIVFAKSDLTGAAKILADFAKENEEMDIIAGCFDSQFFDKAGIQKLATLPSRDILLAQLCGTLAAPMTSLVVVLKQLPVKMLLVMKAIGEKKSS